MNLRKIALRYAKGLLSLSDSKQKVQQMQTDLEEAAALIDKSPRWKEYFSSHLIEAFEKQNLLKKCFADQWSADFINFISVLLEKGRIQLLPEIAEEFVRLSERQLGVLRASVVTAEPLDEKNRDQLTKKFESVFNSKLELKEEVDPEIIGGVILMIGDHMIDYSIRNRLQKLQDVLLA